MTSVFAAFSWSRLEPHLSETSLMHLCRCGAIAVDQNYCVGSNEERVLYCRIVATATVVPSARKMHLGSC